MAIALKTHATGETRVISYDEFKERVRRGEILPEDQVQDRILTNDQWWTVDNLRIFHRLCPIRYTKGPHLVARERGEEEERRLEEISRMQAAEQAALARKFFRVDQPESDIILASLFQFLTACDEQPLAGHDFAVRFTYLPSFHTPLFVRASRLGAKWELHSRSGSDSESARSLLAWKRLFEKASGRWRRWFGVPPLGGLRVLSAEAGTPNMRFQTRSKDVERVLDLAALVNLGDMPSREDVVGLDGATWASVRVWKMPIFTCNDIVQASRVL
jgi:hypothetical protein